MFVEKDDNKMGGIIIVIIYVQDDPFLSPCNFISECMLNREQFCKLQDLKGFLLSVFFNKEKEQCDKIYIII